jgi:ketopantoate reductase
MDKVFDECYKILQLEKKYSFATYDFEKDAAYNALKIRYGNHYPSLHQDIILERKTEIEQIN